MKAELGFGDWEIGSRLLDVGLEFCLAMYAVYFIGMSEKAQAI